MRDASGCVTQFISNGRDLTDWLRLEAQLLQAQKTDAIGRLAGGVAHDFNNLLTIITSYSELALDAVVQGSPIESKLQEILSAARRAAQLTRQLLAFSRKQVQALRIVDLNPVVADITPTLHRLIGEDIELNFVPGDGLGRVRVEPGTGRADPDEPGRQCPGCHAPGWPYHRRNFRGRTRRVLHPEKTCAHSPCHYVMVTVSDNGAGIPSDHLPHVFEPFDTTKPSGKGTGLGLATVYGIVKQNRGFIWAYNESGTGSVFKVYLPCVTDQGAHARRS